METHYIIIRIVSISTLLYILRLIHNHKLRIGNSWYLLILGTGFFILSAWPGAVDILSLFTGTNSHFSNVLSFLIIFLFVIVVQCTLMISSLVNHVKELGQEITLLSSEINEEKIKREAGMAHAINAATMSPIISDELRKITLNQVAKERGTSVNKIKVDSYEHKNGTLQTNKVIT